MFEWFVEYKSLELQDETGTQTMKGRWKAGPYLDRDYLDV